MRDCGVIRSTVSDPGLHELWIGAYVERYFLRPGTGDPQPNERCDYRLTGKGRLFAPRLGSGMVRVMHDGYRIALA